MELESNLDIAEAVVQVLKHLITNVDPDPELTDKDVQLQENVRVAEASLNVSKPGSSNGQDLRRTSRRRSVPHRFMKSSEEGITGNTRVIPVTREKNAVTKGQQAGESSILVCLFCGFSSKRKYRYQMETHICVHTGERPFQCLKCPESFTSKRALVDHEKRDHEETQVVVSQPRKKRSSDNTNTPDRQVNEQRRLSSPSMSLPNYVCNTCDNSYSKMSSLRKHQLRVHMPDGYACQYCSSTFHLPYLIRNHMTKEHVRNGEDPVMCGICKNYFCSDADMNEHLCKGPPPPRIYFPPRNCDQSEQRPSTARNKNQKRDTFPIDYQDDSDVEEVEDEFQEDEEEDDFQSQEELPPSISLMKPLSNIAQQQETEQGVEMEVIDDEVESLPPPTLDDMSVKLEVQLEEGDHEVELSSVENFTLGRSTCETSRSSTIPFTNLSQEEILSQFNTKISSPSKKRTILYRRLRYSNKPTATKMTRRCPLCAREFAGVAMLKTHLLEHTSYQMPSNIRPKDGKNFSTGKALREHQSLHKPGVYACNHCPKTFPTFRGFKYHMLGVHTPMNKRPFQCRYCVHAYAYPSHLRRHVKKVHPSKPKPIIDVAIFNKIKISSRDFTLVGEPQTDVHEFSDGTRKSFSDQDLSFHDDVISETQSDIDEEWSESKKKASNRGKGVFSCQICSSGPYTYKKSLQRHMRKQHGKELALQKKQDNQRGVSIENKASSSRGVGLSTEGNMINGKSGGAKTTLKPSSKQKCTFYCNICKVSATYSYEHSVKRHIMRSHGKTRVATSDFSLSIANPIAEETQHTEDKAASSRMSSRRASTSDSFPCSYCGKMYYHPSNLDQHVRQNHSGSPPTTKAKATNSEDDSSGDARQIQRANGGKKTSVSKIRSRRSSRGSYECPHCDKVYNYRPSVTRHVRQCHKRGASGKPKAVIPGSSSSTGVVVGNQVKGRQGSGRRGTISKISKPVSDSHQCPYCDKRYANRANVGRHVRKMHKHGKRSRSTVRPNKTKLHESSVQGEGRKISFYEICNKLKSKNGFQKAKNKFLKKETNSKKRPRMVYSCEICPLTFPTKTVLTAHVMRKHSDGSNGKPYSCKGCKNGFITSTELKRHQCPAQLAAQPVEAPSPHHPQWWERLGEREQEEIKATATVDNLLNDADKQLLQMICNT